MEEYQDLAREIQRLWKTSAKVIPTVVEALGPVASVDEYTMDVGYGKEREKTEYSCSALLGSARILRKVLDISG